MTTEEQNSAEDQTATWREAFQLIHQEMTDAAQSPSNEGERTDLVREAARLAYDLLYNRPQP